MKCLDALALSQERELEVAKAELNHLKPGRVGLYIRPFSSSLNPRNCMMLCILETEDNARILF